MKDGIIEYVSRYQKGEPTKKNYILSGHVRLGGAKKCKFLCMVGKCSKFYENKQTIFVCMKKRTFFLIQSVKALGWGGANSLNGHLR